MSDKLLGHVHTRERTEDWNYRDSLHSEVQLMGAPNAVPRSRLFAPGDPARVLPDSPDVHQHIRAEVLRGQLGRSV